MRRRSQVGGPAAAQERPVAAPDIAQAVTARPAQSDAVVTPPGVTVEALGTPRELLTFGPDAELWNAAPGDPRGFSALTGRAVRGAIVRLRPPRGATGGLVSQVEEACRKAGAVAVKVEAPRERDTPEGDALVRTRVSLTVEQRVAEVVARDVPEELREAVTATALLALERGRDATRPQLVPSCTTPLWVTRVELRNWFRFRDASVELRPTVYGVVAVDDSDPERSNWLGKSTFLSAIPFALYGWHPADSDDDWLMGRPEGEVVVALSDGSTVRRAKRRGGNTKVEFTCGGKLLVSDAARSALPRHVGLAEVDFFASAHLRQKELSRLVTGRASDVLRVVAGWLELGPLDAAYREAKARLQGLVSSIARCEVQLSEAARRYEQVVSRAAGKFSFELEEDPARHLSGLYDEIEQALVSAHVRAEQIEQSLGAVRAAARLLDLVEAGEEAARQLRRLGDAPPAEPVDEQRVAVERVAAAATRAHQEVTLMSAEVARRRRLVVQGFDGKCPVVAMQCPARAEVDSRKAAAREQLEAAVADEAAAQARWKPVAEELDAAKVRLQSLEREEWQHRTAREKLEAAVAAGSRAAEELSKLPVEAREYARDAERHARELRECTLEVGRLNGERAEVLAMLVDLRDLAAQRELAESVRADAERELAAWRHAVRIFGPGGVPRLHAQGQLAEIEAGANAILAGASGELRVAVEWGYDSATALASDCACGHEFGTSRAKQCPKCATPRPPQFVPEVRVAANQRSGAAEDLAGLAVQVAASAWLRTSRGSQWQCLAVDEPFGALDRAHARALGAHLAAMLPQHGVRQAFVVAHSIAAMDAMPARIVVRGRADGSSTVEVER